MIVSLWVPAPRWSSYARRRIVLAFVLKIARIAAEYATRLKELKAAEPDPES
ncbi:hypothetical protein SSPO_001850 [Streptomyces antimycoticus]|uniref:Uncharacterized protein n=1 Tax=Streptomyces antimycoticus TaxID=68175 RepID=A0A499UUB3_9ACTN|nr:hypothetical protein [Streptomyces antimycoticus]BBJ37467.1 hypothetical protein SSPO_001850 [Streptomyces antimycoticus]